MEVYSRGSISFTIFYPPLNDVEQDAKKRMLPESGNWYLYPSVCCAYVKKQNMVYRIFSESKSR